MFKKYFPFFVTLFVLSAIVLRGQSPYGRVLTLDNNGSQQWILITDVLNNLPGGSSAWLTNGNSIASGAFLGTTNNQPLLVKTNNTDRFRFTTQGQIEVLNSAGSVFVGEGAGANQDNSANRWNVFVGYQSGYSNTTGYQNTASGANALRSNTSGYSNTASGAAALYSNTTGIENTASGYRALYSNTTGSGNTASGVGALYFNTTGYVNTASGGYALFSNTTGIENTASGGYALRSNTTGNWNTASGFGALYSNTTGYSNTASGDGALLSNTTGYENTALGYSAGSNLTTGSNNILIGYNAQPSSATVNNEVTIGNSNNNVYRMYAASWTNASDARYKHDIEDLEFGLDFIMRLKPRRYIYNNSTDNKITMGFVAQEVQSVMNMFGMENYNLVKIFEKDYLGLNTTEIIPILVKAAQEQQQEIEKLQQENEELKQINQKYTSEIEALRSEIENIKKHLVNVGALGSTK